MRKKSKCFQRHLAWRFGRHSYEEPILIQWLYFEKSKRDLSDKNIFLIIEIILDTDNSGHDCILKKL